MFLYIYVYVVQIITLGRLGHAQTSVAILRAGTDKRMSVEPHFTSFSTRHIKRSMYVYILTSYPLTLSMHPSSILMLCACLLINSTNIYFILDGYTPLHLAFICTSKISISELLSAKANPEIKTKNDSRTILHLAVDRGNMDLVKFVIENTPVSFILNTTFDFYYICI